MSTFIDDGRNGKPQADIWTYTVNKADVMCMMTGENVIVCDVEDDKDRRMGG